MKRGTETEQFNIRLSKELLSDLNIVSKLLKLNKTEWVKTKLAEAVAEEKNKLLLRLHNLYSHDRASKEEIQKLLGKDIAEHLESLKKKDALIPQSPHRPASYIH